MDHEWEQSPTFRNSDKEWSTIERPIPDREIAQFQELIWTNFRREGRRFPWRETRDPYRILVSEFMLQQTQTERVLPKYESFLNRFPAMADLADATLRDVLLEWQGLGYNRRARFLHECVRIISERHNGQLPGEPAVLVTLPGIGSGTAGALAAFAYDVPTVFIETNIRRVFLHFFFPGIEGVRDRELYPLIERCLDRSNPREWYYALMDYGVALKTRFPNPNRRSAHYAVQSAFQGSNRQIRGAVIRILTSRSDADFATLNESTGRNSERLERILEELTAEGMIVADPDQDSYRIG